jgi:hypothetical protein
MTIDIHADLLEVLGYRALTRTVELFPYVPSVIGELFPPEPIQGQSASWDIFARGRGVAAPNSPSGQAHVNRLEKVGRGTSDMITLFDTKPLPGSMLNKLREEGTLEKGSRGRITRELSTLHTTYMRTRDFYAFQALAGQIVVNNADIKFTVDTKVPATHKVSGAKVWSDTSADIIGDLTLWSTLISQDSGLMPTRAFVNSITMGWMMKNVGVQKFLGQQQYAVQVGQERWIARIAALNFVREDGGYTDDDGVFHKWIPDGGVRIVPSDIGWASMQTGTTDVPDISGQTIKEVAAPAAWSSVGENPPMLNLYERDAFLPVIYIPAAVVVADVSQALPT